LRSRKGGKYIISKRKLFSIALMSAVIILVLISITDAAPFAYITNSGSNNVSVINTATDKVTATVDGAVEGPGIAATQDGKKVYVANMNSDNFSVIDAATNKVTATVPLGNETTQLVPYGIAVSPDGKKVYVANNGGGCATRGAGLSLLLTQRQIKLQTL
jgi:YVTN family beta-propeller protein